MLRNFAVDWTTAVDPDKLIQHLNLKETAMSQKYKSLASRAAWTAAQAALALITVEVIDVPLVWAPILATALSALKSFVATKVGDPDTVTFK